MKWTSEKQALGKVGEATWVFLLSAIVYIGGIILIGYVIQWLTG